MCPKIVALTLVCLLGRVSSSKIIGDPVPPPYPILSVHVPEPAAGASERRAAAADRAAEAQAVRDASESLSSLQVEISKGFDALVEKIEAAMNMASGKRSVERSASFVALADPMSTMKDLIASTPVSTAPDMSAITSTSDIIKGIASVDAPQPTPTPLDPRPIIYASCERDTSACPIGWESVGAIFGGDAEYCAAGPTYFGPCVSEPTSFAGMSDAAKTRWSAMCQAVWPCVACERDYSAACPAGWVAAGTSCSPPSGYAGPCGADDFAGYNSAMLDKWSSECGAFWACK